MFKYPPAWISTRLSSQAGIIKLLWILLGLSVLIAMIKPTQASGNITPPATVPGTYQWGNYEVQNNQTVLIWYPTLRAACDGQAANWRVVYFQIPAYLGAYCLQVGGKNSAVIALPNYYSTLPKNKNVSSGTYTQYICPTGYGTANVTWNQTTVPWTPTVSCRLTACPANSTGAKPSCTCNTGYVPDATATSCVLEQFTLTLNSPAGDIEPTGTTAVGNVTTKVMSVRVVNNATPPQPKNGAIVRITLDVQPGSGGHNHHDAQRPKGTLTDCAPASISGSYDCNTGADGYAEFTFKSTQVSGTHYVIAICTNPTCVNNPQTAVIDVKVAGLLDIPASPFYGFKSPNGDTNHPYTYFLKPKFSRKLNDIAMFYSINTNLKSKQGVIPDFVLTETSLKWGGVLDCFLTCPDSVPWGPAHKEHRRGSVVDVRANGVAGSIVYEDDLREASLDEDVDIGRAHGSGGGRHFHIKLNDGAKE